MMLEKYNDLFHEQVSFILKVFAVQMLNSSNIAHATNMLRFHSQVTIVTQRTFTASEFSNALTKSFPC